MAEKKVSFWRIFWPSIVAGMVLSIFGWIFWLLVLGSALSEPPVVKNNAVLHLKLEGEIAERSDNQFDRTAFQISNKLGLADILFGLQEAKNDANVKGIYLDLGNISCGYATAKEIREGILDFQSSGKFVIAYLDGEVITQKQYYVASAAKEVYAFQSSAMEFVGVGGELMFFKKFFDNLGLEMQVIRGSNNDFKSAVEPYFRENMSDSSRLQTQRYMTSIWGTVLSDIAKSRKTTVEKLNSYAETIAIKRAEDAKNLGLIDGIKYKDEIEELIAKKGDLAELSDIESFEKYAKTAFKQNQLGISSGDDNVVAIISAEGGISVNGDEMTSEAVCRDFRKVRNDNGVKVVVFRINSPGGSALASEEIWREVSLTAKKKKVIVSMGDVAASGGYYIATPADRIFAEPTTITGSIGVFGVIPFTGNALETQLGLTFDRVQTNSHAVLSLNRKLSPEEMLSLQEEVDNTYLQFKTRVANGRKLTLEQVQVLARGRVWTGEDALKNGLVDEIGGLQSAIAYAIKSNKLKDPTIRYYPIVKEEPFDELLEQLSQQEEVQSAMKVGEAEQLAQSVMKRLKMIDAWSGIQMRLPYDINIR